MTHGIPFSVATLGFEERERLALRDLLRISEHRSPTFSARVRTSGQLPHIVIVNAERPDAIERWRAFRSANEGATEFSAVMLGTQAPAGAREYSLGRPLVLAHLFTLLERIVIEVQGYQRPVVSANESSLFVLSPEELPAANIAVPAESEVAQIAVIMDGPVNVGAHAKDATPATPPPRAVVASDTAASSTISGPELAGQPGVLAAEATSPTATTVSAASQPDPNSTAPVGRALDDASAIVAPASKLRVSSVSDQAVPGGATKTRILVVDDSLPVRIQMKTALESFTKSIDFADNGDQAVLLIDNCKYDVIFLDVIMPGRDGYDVCRYIRRHPLQKKTPVIMLTGSSSPADRVKGKLAGCDTYLIKPVRQSILAEVIGEFIKSSAAA
jgi:CheY-like chemotaxis protein